MNIEIIIGLLLPFVGTSLGAMTVLFMRKEINPDIQRMLTGFAAGVMMSASFWGLLLPAVEQTNPDMGKLSFFPAVAGFCLGMLFLLLIDTITPHMHLDESVEGPKKDIKKTTMLVLAVVIHNIPEGMAVGVVYAGLKSGNAVITASGALALSIGIAIQNFPEGAIISLPLRAEGMSRKKACLYGILSGVVEPIGAIITLELTGIVVPALPYLLCFAAGAMIYVVVEELIPEAVEGEHTNIGTLMFALGFSVMMVMDVALG